MKISYDSKVDAMYIAFKKGKYDRTKKGDVLGIEILDAKKQFGEIKPDKIIISSKPSYQGA